MQSTDTERITTSMMRGYVGKTRSYREANDLFLTGNRFRSRLLKEPFGDLKERLTLMTRLDLEEPQTLVMKEKLFTFNCLQ